MKKALLGLLFAVKIVSAQVTPFEKSNKTQSATYQQCVAWYRQFVEKNPDFELDSIGKGDCGKPIYVCKWVHHSNSGAALNVLINNNIHPGEPEGTDASMLLLRQLAQNKDLQKALQNVNIHVICQYNVDGTLNRNCCSRANQNGPEEFGFRGNAKNLDLNRDFIKMDSRNAQTFVRYFAKHNFHIFIDNHTSNGADYQYTLTSFITHPAKLAIPLQSIAQQLNTEITSALDKNNWPNCPYVELMGNTPEKGIHAFWETGRYATGYAALHHCIGFCVETHMLKPFPQRVQATLAYMLQALQSSAQNQDAIIAAKRQAQSRSLIPKIIYTQWQLDTNKFTKINFLGYKHAYKNSLVTGHQRLYYDTTKPQTMQVPYYTNYIPTDSVQLPKFYIIPQAWQAVIQNLLANGIEYKFIPYDTAMLVSTKYIRNYQTVSKPYESHYMHYQTQCRDTQQVVQLMAGDIVIPTKQSLALFIAMALEPTAPDSYFNWNFFDGILMQKEYFSNYVWEDKAYQILQSNSLLRKQFEQKKSSDLQFAANSQAQLEYIYTHSLYYEASHMRYPVYSIY